MMRHRARRLSSRLFTLFVLVAALAALSANPPRQKADIIPPCEYCENMLNNCVANCGMLGSTSACLNQCSNRYSNCTSNCR